MTVVTDANGNYSFSSLLPGNYTVTPSRTPYTFTPPSVTIQNLVEDRTAVNFSGLAQGTNLAPTVSTVTSAPFSPFGGWSVTWTASMADPNGRNDIRAIEMYWGLVPEGQWASGRACSVKWEMAVGTFSLANDNGGTSWITAPAQLSNSYCNVLSASTTPTGVTTRTASVEVGFKNAMAGENFPVWVRVTDLAGLTTGWQALGGWIVPPQ